ncbi:hypothetical protein KI387_006789, partial [Taxus chinensis]
GGGDALPLLCKLLRLKFTKPRALRVFWFVLAGQAFEPPGLGEKNNSKNRGFWVWVFVMDTMVCNPLSLRQYEYNTEVGSEPFRIDDLLDFSNDDIGAPIDEENTSEETSPSASLDGNYSPENENNQAANQEPTDELCVP